MAAYVMHPSLAVVATPHGRGLRATAPVRAGERLLYAPAAAQLDGVDADELATTLLAELERGTHKWLASLPRGVAYSAAGCDDATRAALCATAGGGLGDCAFVRSVGQAQGRADQRWARSFVVANALRVKSGHLRLAPLFTLLNHAEDGLRPTELEDGALSLEAARDLQPGDDVRIDYGHGSHGGAGVLHRYGWFPSTAATEFVVFDEASDDVVLESLRKRLALDNGVTLRSDAPGRDAEALELASLLPVLSSNSLASLARRLDRGEDGDDLSTSQASPTKSASSSCGLFGLFAAETDRDVAYGWLLRRSPQLLARARAHCCSVLDSALSASRKNAASAIAHGGAAVASLREHCARYRQAREAMLERYAAPLRCSKS